MCDYNWEKYNYDFYGHPESDLPPGLLLTYPVKVYTVCPGSSDPFYIGSLLYKTDHYFLDTLYYIVP